MAERPPRRGGGAPGPRGAPAEAVPHPDLGAFLERLHRRYATPALLDSDPLGMVVPYRRADDREVAGFVAAGLSFGNVRAIRDGIRRALAPLGERPAERLREASDTTTARWARGFGFRWIREDDLAAVYRMLGHALRTRGGLEPLFADGMAEARRAAGGQPIDVRPGLRALVDGLAEPLTEQARSRRGTRYFLSRPDGTGAFKRLNMFLRWMVRPAGVDVDLGLWTAATPAQLLMPLDTHVARLSRYLGLTSRATVGLAMALEVTEALRRYDPDDPVKYDFALSRLGILRDCPRRRAPERCAACVLFEPCRL